MSSKLVFLTIALSTLVFNEIRANASFIMPDDTRAKIGGGMNLIAASAHPESLSFTSIFQKTPKQYQQQSPRMSETSFRLDYIQGMRSSYNKASAIAPVEDENENTQDEDFVYGLDSTSYRGLTNPTKAGLILGLVLASGMVATSPELHMSLPSLPSLLEGSRHLMGDDAASTLSTLVERMDFRWDMSGLPESVHQVSDQVAASFNSKLVPFVSQQREHWQEGLTALSSRFDVFPAQMSSQTDEMKEEFMGKMASAEVMVGQVLVTSKAAVSQQSNEWQLASHAKIDQWQHDLVQATDHVQGGLSQVLTKGKEMVADKASNSQTKMKEVGQNVIQVTDNVRSVFANIGTEFGLKRKEIDDDVVPMIQDSSRLLHDKMMAFRDTSLVDVNKVQDHLAFQGHTSIDTIGDTLQKWKDSTANQWSSF